MLIRRVFAVFLAMAILVVVVGFFLPRTIVVERSVVMDHPAEAIFDVLKDFRHFPQWSPWFTRVPEADFRIEGPDSGMGSTLVWSDESGSGEGRLWIVGLTPPARVDLQLELGDTEADGYFVVQAADPAGQEVTWGLRFEVSQFDLVGRYMGLILHRLVGREYAEGLERLSDYLDRYDGQPPVPDQPGLE